MKSVISILLIFLTTSSGFLGSSIVRLRRTKLNSDKLQGEWKKKAALGPSKEGLVGTIPVVFMPENKETMAIVGQPLSEVAIQADVFIKYKVRVLVM